MNTREKAQLGCLVRFEFSNRKPFTPWRSIFRKISEQYEEKYRRESTRWCCAAITHDLLRTAD